MSSDEADREIGELKVQVKSLQEEVRILRLARHDHSQKLSVHVNLMGAVKALSKRLKDVEGLLKDIELWKNRRIGAAGAYSTIGGVVGAIAAILLQYLLSKWK